MTARPLEGRAVLVTGGSRGIGRAVAESTAAAGAEVHVVSRSPEAPDWLTRCGGRVWSADLADEKSVASTLDGVLESIGHAPDALVSAAGVFRAAPVARTSVDTFDHVVGVNLRGAFLVLRTLLPAFLERGEGRIVHVGSVAGRRGLPGNGAYAASKYGLRGLHEVLLEELRGTGVAATLLEPGATDTPLWDPIDPDGDPAFPSRVEMLRPSDVAEAILFVLTRPPEVRIPLLPIERGHIAPCTSSASRPTTTPPIS